MSKEGFPYGSQANDPFGAEADLRKVGAPLGEATLRQLEKDFLLQGLHLQLPECPPSYELLMAIMTDFLEKEDVLHSDSLARVLYQMDLSEADIRAKIAQTDPAQITTAIADAMVRRCFAKVLLRHTYGTSGTA